MFENDQVIARGLVTAIRQEKGLTYADCDIWLERGNDRPLEGAATVLTRN